MNAKIAYNSTYSKLKFYILPFTYTQFKPSYRASLVAQKVKNLPAMQETWVQSLGQENSLEKETATHSNSIAWEIPWTEEPGGLQSMEWQRVGDD